MPAASRRRWIVWVNSPLRPSQPPRHGAASRCHGHLPLMRAPHARGRAGPNFPGVIHERRRQPSGPNPSDHRLEESGLRRSRQTGRGDAPGLRHLPRLPALLQSVRFLPAPVRPDRFKPQGRRRAPEVRRLQAGGGGLHPLRHVLHDQMPLCAAASLHAGFSPPDAAPPLRRDKGGQPQRGVHPAAACGNGSQRQGGTLCFADRQLGVRQVQHRRPRLAGQDLGHRRQGDAAQISCPYLHRRGEAGAG